jgi:hypothetical protein
MLSNKISLRLAAYGCSLRLELNQVPNFDEVKTYTVPAEYRTKTDAKVALACHAAEAGAIEFLRFRGRPAPPRYTPFISTRNQDLSNAKSTKRKDPFQKDALDFSARKKAKVDRGESDVPLLLTKEEAALQRPRLSQDKAGKNSKRKWKKPPRSGSNGLAPVSRPAQTGRPTGQHRFRPGFGGKSTSPYSGPQSHQHGPVPSFPAGRGSGSGFSHSHSLPPHSEHVAPYPLAPPPPHISTYAPPGYAPPYYGMPAAPPMQPPPIYVSPQFVTQPYRSFSPHPQSIAQYGPPSIPLSAPSAYHSQHTSPSTVHARQPPTGPRNAVVS